MTNRENDIMQAATVAGRHQAFALMGSKCSHAQAACLKQLRDTRAHEPLGLSWDDFCKQHAGISRSQADHLIRQLEEFGRAYFELSRIVDISDRTYRELAPHIDGETIALLGDKIPIVPENAARIRTGIRMLRDEIRLAHIDVIGNRAGLPDLDNRLKSLVDEFRRRARFPMTDDEDVPEDRAALSDMLRRAISSLKDVLHEYARPAV